MSSCVAQWLSYFTLMRIRLEFDSQYWSRFFRMLALWNFEIKAEKNVRRRSTGAFKKYREKLEENKKVRTRNSRKSIKNDFSENSKKIDGK